MIKTIIIGAILVFGFSAANLTKFTEGTNQLLEGHVKDGLVDYQALAKEPGSVKALYQKIGDISLADASDAEKKAFYINAYNIITIHQIIQNYPVKSPMDINGFFDKKKHQVAGESLTLNQLEKERLLKNHFDPRAHFVLVCAALSCPPLADFAYQADQLDEQLEEKTRQTLNNPDFIRVNQSQKKVLVSKIFDWYKSDFTKNQSVLEYINQYKDEKIPASYQLDYYEYDWSLNDM
jgi:hypothetical protein